MTNKDKKGKKVLDGTDRFDVFGDDLGPIEYDEEGYPYVDPNGEAYRLHLTSSGMLVRSYRIDKEKFAQTVRDIRDGIWYD